MGKKDNLKKQLIIKEATKLFTEYGYSGMKIVDLAKRVNLSVGSIYKFFGSKEILYNHYLLTQREYYLSIIKSEILKYNTPLDKLEIITQILLNIFVENKNILKENASKNPSFFMNIEPKDNNSTFKFYKAIEKEVMKPLSKTIPTKIDTLEMAFIFGGLLIGTYNYSLIKDDDLMKSRDTLIKRFLSIIKEE